MKLIFCKSCNSIYNISEIPKSCTCGKTKAMYIDDENAIYGGRNAVCLGVDNNAFTAAHRNQPLDGNGIRFDSYVCATWSNSTIKIKNLEKMSDNEIYTMLFTYYNYNIPKLWIKKVNKKRTGFARNLYLLCKSIMNIEIKKLDKKILSPDLDKWFNNFTERILNLSKRLAKITSTQTRWFYALVRILINEPELIIEFEKPKSNKALYAKVYNYVVYLNYLDEENNKNGKRKENAKS